MVKKTFKMILCTRLVYVIDLPTQNLKAVFPSVHCSNMWREQRWIDRFMTTNIIIKEQGLSKASGAIQELLKIVQVRVAKFLNAACHMSSTKPFTGVGHL